MLRKRACTPSGAGRSLHDVELNVELRTVEFVAVDVETNGRPGEACELTEVGAVLVGGGELHERFSSLIAVSEPLSAGIQRFTGITQRMVDGAPRPEGPLRRLAAMLEGRVLVAHNASFDRRALRQGFSRAGVRWPNPPVLCTLTLARRLAPLANDRKLAALAGSLGVEVRESHRALPDAETCARVFCALFPRLCANAPTLADAVQMLSPRRRARSRARGAEPTAPARASRERPDVAALPREPGVYVFRDDRGRALYVGKSVSVRARARAHLGGSEPAEWAESAHLVEHRPTHSELGALVLENRLIKALRPPGNRALKRVDGLVFLCARLDIDYPILEVLRAPPAGRAVAVGPLRGRTAALELVEQLSSIFGLRHCGRRLRRRPHPSAYGQMGRCLSPCLGDLDPNLYRRRLDAALGLFTAREDGGALLLARIEEDMRAASAERRYERAAALRRRHERLEILLGRLGGVLRALHARPRLALAPHPAADRWDALWLVGGRVIDWGPLPAVDELHRRTRAALAQAPLPGAAAVLAREDVDEVRIVAAWLARHPETPTLELEPAPGPRALAEFLARARSAGRVARPVGALAPPVAPVADRQPRGEGDDRAEVHGEAHVPVAEVREHHDAGHSLARR
jgi:DNA polymerase III subunit epsilon